MKMLNENHMLMDWYQYLSVSIFVKDIFKDEICKVLLQVSTNMNISTDFDTKHTFWTQIKQNVILPQIILFFSLDPLQKLFSIIILWISSIKNLWNSSLSCYIISLILFLGPLQKKLADPYPTSSLPHTHTPHKIPGCECSGFCFFNHPCLSFSNTTEPCLPQGFFCLLQTLPGIPWKVHSCGTEPLTCRVCTNST